MLKRRKGCTITIELTAQETDYIRQCCIGRVATSAIRALPDDYEYLDDMEELITLVEPLRYRMASAIFEAETKEEEASSKVEVIHHTGGKHGEE